MSNGSAIVDANFGDISIDVVTMKYFYFLILTIKAKEIHHFSTLF